MKILTWTHQQAVLAVLLLFQRHLITNAAQFNIIDPEDSFFRETKRNDDNDPSKLSKVVEFQYWLQTLQHKSKTETVTMQKFQERTKEALDEAFSNSSASQNLDITVDRITWRRVDGTCEEDFPQLEGYSCLIVHSEVALGYTLANNTNNTDVFDTRFLEETTIDYVDQFFHAFNLDNQPFPYIQVQLRSPLRVGTTIQLEFYNVKTRLGEDEETILRKAFFKDYQNALASHKDPTFNLTDMQVFLNAMMDAPDHQRKRKLNLRSNENSSDSEKILRLDLYVQATCAGLTCQEEIFHDTLHSMMDNTRKTFVETLKQKGHFTALNDYFEDLSFIKILDDDALPTRSDDPNNIDKIAVPQQTSDYEMPFWFWMAILVSLLLLSGTALVLVVLAIKKKRFHTVMEELTHAEQKNMDLEGEPQKETKNHPAKRREASKSPSPRKRFVNNVFPLTPEEADDSVLVYPTQPQESPTESTGSTTTSPKYIQNNNTGDRVVPSTSLDSTPTLATTTTKIV